MLRPCAAVFARGGSACLLRVPLLSLGVGLCAVRSAGCGYVQDIRGSARVVHQGGWEAHEALGTKSMVYIAFHIQVLGLGAGSVRCQCHLTH